MYIYILLSRADGTFAITPYHLLDDIQCPRRANGQPTLVCRYKGIYKKKSHINMSLLL